jgi:predicted deacylase
VYGFLEFSRDISDGKDINRSFPGLKNGSLASRVARLLSDQFLSKATRLLDFHTGGGTRYNFPHTRYFPGDIKATEMAKIFGASVIMESNLIGKSLRKTAFDKFIPTVVFEGAEAGRYCQDSINVGLQGIQNILSNLKMTEKPLKQTEKILIIKKNSWIRAPKAGMFLWKESAGSFIRKGQTIGVISDPYGIKTHTILSKKEGFILGHNNASVVSLGDPLFHVGTSYIFES